MSTLGTVKVRCRICGVVHSVEVPKDGFLRWRGGEHIQSALPSLTTDERELLLSGICGRCFDNLFKDTEE